MRAENINRSARRRVLDSVLDESRERSLHLADTHAHGPHIGRDELTYGAAGQQASHSCKGRRDERRRLHCIRRIERPRLAASE